MKLKNIFWGLFFLASGLLVVLNGLGYLSILNLSLITMLYAVILIAIFIKSLIHLNWFGLSFSVALLYIIFAKSLGLPFIGYSAVLITALFFTIGLSILFKPRWKWMSKIKTHHFDDQIIENSNDEEVNINANFGSTASYITSQDLKKINLKASFSEVKLFFDEAKLHNGKAILNLSVHLSGVEIFVPKNWKVKINTNNNLAGVDDRIHFTDKKTEELTIVGDVTLAGVEIRYI